MLFPTKANAVTPTVIRIVLPYIVNDLFSVLYSLHRRERYKNMVTKR